MYISDLSIFESPGELGLDGYCIGLGELLDGLVENIREYVIRYILEDTSRYCFQLNPAVCFTFSDDYDLIVQSIISQSRFDRESLLKTRVFEFILAAYDSWNDKVKESISKIAFYLEDLPKYLEQLGIDTLPKLGQFLSVNFSPILPPDCVDKLSVSVWENYNGKVFLRIQEYPGPSIETSIPNMIRSIVNVELKY